MRNYNSDVIFVDIYGNYIVKHLFARFDIDLTQYSRF